MPVLIAAAAAVVFLAFYLWACLYALIYVAVPLGVAAAGVGAAAGIGLALLLALLAYGGRRGGIVLIGPSAVQKGAVGGPAQPPGRPRRDPAWPTYFAAQARHDLTGILRRQAGAVGGAWLACAAAAARVHRILWLFLWPVVPGVVAFLVTLTIGAAAGGLVCAAVVALAAAVAWLAGGALAGTLRGADALWQRLFHAAASCPRCYYVTRLPAYRCSCDDLHRDIRPGKLGVLWRRCGGRSETCNRRLPTTVLRAARVMAPVCQRCGTDLHAGAAVATDVRIPVFGATMAGKTRLIAAGLVLLKDAAGPRASFADRASEKTYLDHRADVGGDRPVPKTARGNPVATTLGLDSGRRHALVHLFDAAGEMLVDRAENAQLSYLDQARTLMFVLDPFAVPDVRERLTGPLAATLIEANASPHDPEASYNSTVQRLRDAGIDTHRRRLAFVVTKADLLQDLPADLGLRIGPDPAVWLHERGLDNLLLSARRDFGDVRIFVVSSMNRTPDGAATALEPLRWLLAGEGITV